MDLNSQQQQGSSTTDESDGQKNVIDTFIKKVTGLKKTVTKEVASGTTRCSSEKSDSQEKRTDITSESKNIDDHNNELFCTEEMSDEEKPLADQEMKQEDEVHTSL